MQVIQVTLAETPHAPRVGRMNRHGGAGSAIAKTKPQAAIRAVGRVLKRGPMPQGQQALLKALYEADNASLTATELTALLGRDEQQLNRLLARVARCIRRTHGYCNGPASRCCLTSRPSRASGATSCVP